MSSGRLHVPIESPAEIICPAECIGESALPGKNPFAPVDIFAASVNQQYTHGQWKGSSFPQVCETIAQEYETEWTQPNAIFRIPQKKIDASGAEQALLEEGKGKLHKLLDQISVHVFGKMNFPSFKGKHWLLNEELPVPDPSLLPAPSLSAEMWLDVLIASRRGTIELYQTLDRNCLRPSNDVTYSETATKFIDCMHEEDQAAETRRRGEQLSPSKRPREDGATKLDEFAEAYQPLEFKNAESPEKHQTSKRKHTIVARSSDSDGSNELNIYAAPWAHETDNEAMGPTEEREYDPYCDGDAQEGQNICRPSQECHVSTSESSGPPIIISVRLMQSYDFVNALEDQGFKCIARNLEQPIDLIYDESSSIAICNIPLNSGLENGVLPTEWKNFVLHIVRSAKKFRKITVLINVENAASVR
eukprot:gb/GECG01008422.1/.p1 GENE.gb/GECG01008422.1/~~gb/GECG01008422.1/.p1  ORF type:complete len:418 (+),score=48.68 gb/GECG01008422.1/:1-1254(+)